MIYCIDPEIPWGCYQSATAEPPAEKYKWLFSTTSTKFPQAISNSWPGIKGVKRFGLGMVSFLCLATDVFRIELEGLISSHQNSGVPDIEEIYRIDSGSKRQPASTRTTPPWFSLHSHCQEEGIESEHHDQQVQE